MSCGDFRIPSTNENDLLQNHCFFRHGVWRPETALPVAPGSHYLDVIRRIINCHAVVSFL